MSALLLGSISTVVDTSELQRASFNEAFAQHGLDWNWDRDGYRNLLLGNGGRQRIADYAAAHDDAIATSRPAVDAEAVHATKSEIFRNKLAEQSLTARPGVLEAIRDARAAGWKVGLVTTTSGDNVTALLDGLADLSRDDFDVITDVDTVDSPKPDPAVYLAAIDQLGESAENCIAVEDNVGGVHAATAAGIYCVGFPNDNTATHDFGDTPRVDRLEFDDLASAAAKH